MDNDVVDAHRHSIRNRDGVLASSWCGCFYCCESFLPSEVDRWTDEQDGVGQTALCPRCGIDAVIGGAACPVSREFLRRMHDRWFGTP